MHRGECTTRRSGAQAPPSPIAPRTARAPSFAARLAQRGAMAELPPKRIRLRAKTSPETMVPPGRNVDVARVPELMRRAAVSSDFLDAAGLRAEEGRGNNKVYLVTIPHPHSMQHGLRAPAGYDRKQMVCVMQDVFARPVYDASDVANQARPRSGVPLERLCVFQERHASGELHYHIAVTAARSFRFMAYKRALLQRWGLASHWSGHDGYWSCVRYGYLPTPKKPQCSLDPRPEAWQREGEHPPLSQVAQEPNTALALQGRREAAVKALAEKGKAAPRASEMDLYAIIADQGFRNTPDDRTAHKRLALYCKEHCSPEIYRFAFQNRQKLSGLIDSVWEWEEMAQDLATTSLTRLERLRRAGTTPCTCGGLWRRVAENALTQNGIDPADFAEHVFLLFRDGRREDRKVVVLVGRFGGEGKSFLLAPLRAIFGDDVFEPPKDREGTRFPLLGLETKQVVLLDEWSFIADHGVSLNTQLIWMEGKPVPIARPQNNSLYQGHLMYKGKAPVLVTCKEKEMGPVLEEAEQAIRAGTPTAATMLLRRMRRYHLALPLPVPPDTHVPECSCCFAQMVLGNSPTASAGA